MTSPDSSPKVDADAPWDAERERRAWIFLNRVPHLGPQRFHRLLAYARSAEAILKLPVPQLEAAGVRGGLPNAWHTAFRDPQLWSKVDQDLRQAQEGDFRILTELDDAYPERLRDVIGRPPVLYVKGQWPPPEGTPVGLVGTRRPTPYGEWMASQLSADLVARGAITVSGLAAGVDAAVHRTTLEAGGYTIGVLGHGFAHRYPRENKRLFDQILDHGAWVSEFPFEVPPEAMNFPRRNRIIAGLSKILVVVEAGIRSGALITARFAAEQARDVLAVPGRVGEPLTEGCHRLIKEGAMLVESVDDILGPAPGGPYTRKAQEPELDLRTEEERVILNTLTRDPMPIEILTQRSGHPVDRLAEALLSLELQNLIRVFPGQRYGLH